MLLLTVLLSCAPTNSFKWPICETQTQKQISSCRFISGIVCEGRQHTKLVFFAITCQTILTHSRIRENKPVSRAIWVYTSKAKFILSRKTPPIETLCSAAFDAHRKDRKNDFPVCKSNNQITNDHVTDKLPRRTLMSDATTITLLSYRNVSTNI